MKYVIIALGVGLLLTGGSAYLLYEKSVKDAERIGAVETQLKVAADANKAIVNATKQRATTEQSVRRLPDPDLVRRLQ